MLEGKKKIWAGAGVVLAVAAIAGGAGAVMATGGGDDTPITGAALEKASAAALASTGGGRVTETEVGDEDSYYEVEVTLDNGDQVDVQLDENFKVVDSKTEVGGETNDDDGHGDDGDQNDGNNDD